MKILIRSVFFITYLYKIRHHKQLKFISCKLVKRRSFQNKKPLHQLRLIDQYCITPEVEVVQFQYIKSIQPGYFRIQDPFYTRNQLKAISA